MSRILKVSTLRPDTALENLNRLTGLDFEQWPESLLEQPVGSLSLSEQQKPTRKASGQAGTEPYIKQG
ncbi:hypothetical protein [Alcanivorax sediminis]|uniref:Uncharacterized protein n=1 Tax=Alcanivorax sediminis TaxID=2663008 RepID=A0A6N7LWK6_9GAMM|nr:hypothetical protein [Alcanivorax sediminis]MQX54812.1 hypothetical protein [Alcanivorax sediminis]